MKKIYITLALASFFAACTTESASEVNEKENNKSDFADISVVVGSLEDARDGKTYKTVQIKDQVWMAENLNFEADSSFCPQGEAENCDKFGRLYKWAVAMDSSEAVPCGYNVRCNQADSVSQPKVRGICPEGWHLPSDAEWDELIAATGDADHAAKALKSKDVWSADPGEDVYQFNVVPTGYRGVDGIFNQYDALFWSSTESTKGSACYRYFDRDANVKHRSFDKRTARSVRCIKDSD